MLPVGLKNVGAKDSSGTIREQIMQYRGLLKLHGREKKLRAIDGVRLRKRISRELGSLQAEVKEYRGILIEVQGGDKRRLHTLLHQHKDFQLAYENHHPREICDAIDQDNSLKRRQLDKFCYVKQKKVKDFFDLKFELEILADKIEQQSEETESDRDQQRLVALYHESLANETAAKTMRTTYRSMLKILEKDAIYFDTLLKALKVDRTEQCTVLLRTTTMGQLAAEELDDTRQRYKRMAIDVWKNTKERERNLKAVRSQVENLWANARSLVRVESDTDYATKMGRREEVDDDLKRQIDELEATFDKVKDALQIVRYDETYTRFEEQARKKERLVGQYKRLLGERDLYLNKKQHASLILANLEHSVITTTGQYKANKRDILQQIEFQAMREADCQNKQKPKGEVLINIKLALFNMLALLEVVEIGKDVGGKKSTKDDKKVREKVKRTDERESEDERSIRSVKTDTPAVETVDTDAFSMLSQVTKKMTVLFGMSNFDLDEETQRKAESLYHTYVADVRAKMRLEDIKPETDKIDVEHETIDPSVLSREDVKNRSQRIVEANANYH